jgi:DNA helicase-2/ATP-dependent DNA helicase PcrA
MGKGSFGNKFQTARTGGLNKNLGAPPPGNLRSLKDVKRAQASNNESNASNTEIKVGFNVEHERFGKGKVTHMEGSGADQKATIFFPHHGSKTILLRFANLEVLE